MGQGGYQWYQMTHDKHGNLLTNVDMNKARKTMLKETAIMMPVSIALNASQAKIEERVLKSTAKGVFKTARRSGVDMDLDVVKETSKEGLLTVLHKKIKNNLARISGYAIDWNNKVYEKLLNGFVGSRIINGFIDRRHPVLIRSDSETHRSVSSLKNNKAKFEKFVFKSSKKQDVSLKGNLKGKQFELKNNEAEHTI